MTQAKRVNIKAEFSLLLYTINTPQSQRQILPQSKSLQKIFQSNGPKKQAGIAIIMTDSKEFKLKSTEEIETDTLNS